MCCVSAAQQKETPAPTAPKVATSWLLEILASTLSLVSIAGLVIFLHAIDDKPYSSWRIISVDITPNTLLSILSTVCKASFLLCVTEGLSQLKWNYFRQRERRLLDLQHFDDASRGQLGALRLVWSVRHRALLANLGAVITVLAIATDPLTNQILTVRTRPTDATNVTASIGAARAYGLQARDPLTTAVCNYTTPGGINASVQLQSTDGVAVTPDTFLETMISDLGSMAGNNSDRMNIAMDESGSVAGFNDTFDFSIGGDRPANNGNNGVNLVTSPALQQTFYTANGGNVSQTLIDIARSMTDEVRQGPESVVISGSVAYEVAYIEVRWVWIVYLAILCGTAVVFLLGAIVSTWRQGTPVWKSSVLALLSHGGDVGGESFRQLDARDVHAIEKVAEDVKAQLGADDVLYYSRAEKARRT
ncbi:hypothetical protein B0A55_02921 [Friedmanniomyces simplex]|uniref:Uncharacterized protein n=1 Tax=Friedmanniomyces simplex TaxID=329884 RepID=A0A4U0XUR4_9PEZI|nr:hypothetical protein B0A55_02921 [Friedmanniomyces simplex]